MDSLNVRSKWIKFLTLWNSLITKFISELHFSRALLVVDLTFIINPLSWSVVDKSFKIQEVEYSANCFYIISAVMADSNNIRILIVGSTFIIVHNTCSCGFQLYIIYRWCCGDKTENCNYLTNRFMVTIFRMVHQPISQSVSILR